MIKTLQELSETSEFHNLTDKQKMFVSTFISNGYNKIHAIRTAYQCKNDLSAKVMSYSVMNTFAVTMVLAIHFGDEPVDTFLKHIARSIRKGRIKPEQLALYKLYAEVSGWRHGTVQNALALAERLEGKKAAREGLKAVLTTKPKTDTSKYTLDEFEQGS